MLERAGTQTRIRGARRGLDGLLAGGGEVWLVMARDRGELDALLAPGAELHVCRSVGRDGVLRLGVVRADRDALLSQLLGEARVDPV
jgi:hypothetical protein